MKNLLYSAIKPYSAILFINDRVVAFLLLCITFLNPNVAISGIVAILAALAFATFIGFKEEFLSQGFYIYNSLLSGMGIGYLFLFNLQTAFLIIIASIFTFILSFFFNRLFSVYKIPILSLPFSIVTMFIYLASLKYSNLLSSIVNNAVLYDISLPLVISSFFKSLGTIFFLPSNIAGILIAAIMLYASRIIFFMAVVGFYFGVMVNSFFVGSYFQSLIEPYNFNYIIVAIALCGIFLLPTVRNFFIALIGVGISVVLTDAISVLFNYYSIPVFTLPFNIAVISLIFLLSMIYYKEFNIQIKQTPEKSLSAYLSRVFRFGKTHIKIALPFSGKWSVYQGFNGEWTHKGKYKYAYDFVQIKEGRTYANNGDFLEDYYCFGQSVYAPVSGYVVDIRDDLVDNPIGSVDRVNNWGNYIIIKSDLGFFVEISHLMQYSLKVKVGDYIQNGQIIAKCGNSGYSPQPHIHIQIQEVGVIGGFTQEFLFDAFLVDQNLYLNTLPSQDQEIENIVVNKAIASRFIFILDDEFEYDIYKDDKKVGEYSFRVKMNDTGEFYFEDKEGNQLYFYNDMQQFYFYNYVGGESHLKWMFIIAPRVLFISVNTVTFKDVLPLYLTHTPLKVIMLELLSTIKKEYAKQEVSYCFSQEMIESSYGKATFSIAEKGFATLEYNQFILRRKN